MTLDWKALMSRIDDMSLRERAMLFASASLVVVVFAHVVLIDPVLREQKALIDKATRDQSQINAVRAQIHGIVGEGQPRHPDEEAIERLEREIAQAEQAMAARQGAFIAPARLPALLKELLGRNVRLESLRLVPGEPIASTAGLYRHGVELSLKGSYFELLEYLEQLEKTPSLLLWGKVELQVERYPEVRLTVVVHTLSRQRSLLAI